MACLAKHYISKSISNCFPQFEQFLSNFIAIHTCLIFLLEIKVHRFLSMLQSSTILNSFCATQSLQISEGSHFILSLSRDLTVFGENPIKGPLETISMISELTSGETEAHKELACQISQWNFLITAHIESSLLINYQVSFDAKKLPFFKFICAYNVWVISPLFPHPLLNHPAPSLFPPPPRYPAETILPLSLILL
jgi:hypothetical protein